MKINYRNIFIAEPGHVFVKADYSGQELRVLAQVSQDETLLNAFRKGIDIHLLTANRIFNLNLDSESLIEHSPKHKKAKELYKSERDKAKNGVVFPIVYGTTAHGIAENMGISRTEAQKWIDEFFNLYPGVLLAIEQTKNELQKQGFVCTLMTRKRRFPNYMPLIQQVVYLNKQIEKAPMTGNLIKSKMQTITRLDKMVRQAFNFKIQGFSADMTKIAGGLIYPRLARYSAKVLLAVHDEFVFSCPENHAKKFSEFVKNTMENCISLDIPISVECKICRRYGE